MKYLFVAILTILDYIGWNLLMRKEYGKTTLSKSWKDCKNVVMGK